MRTLIVFAVLQTVGTLVLVIHLFMGQAAPEQDPHQPRGAQISPPNTLSCSNVSAPLADEQRLRKIIREELVQLRLQSNPPQSGASVTVAADSRNDPRNRERQELVAQQIETYRAVGSITDQQMIELQAAIARLDEGSRRQMMSRLIRAMNS